MQRFLEYAPLRIVLLLFLLTNLATTSWFSYISWKGKNYLFPKRQYTYVGDDYPTWYDIPIGPVEMTFGETSAYPLTGPTSNEIWETMRSIKTHQGYVRLGPDKRVFAVAMFHELHCVNTFRKALVDHNDKEANAHHVQHCMNYLRQFFLCSADGTLERGDFMKRDSEDRVGTTRVCKDWSVVYEQADANFWEWREWLQANRTRAYELKHPKNSTTSAILS